MPSLKQTMHTGEYISLDDVCFLVSVEITKDELMQEIEKETERQIFCTLSNISRQEFSVSMKAGLKASKVIIVDYDEYDGEEKVKYDGHAYSIYRTFVRKDGYIELYCEERVGNG
jgi:SPP1 family predicted phage head-tail adaptor